MPRYLKLLLFAAFLNGLTWILIIPVWQYPDEQAHFAQVQDLAELGGVPVGSPDTSKEIVMSELYLDTKRDHLGNNKFIYHPEYKLEYTNSIYGVGEKEISDLPKSARTTMFASEATNNPPLYYLLASRIYKIVGNTNLFTRVSAVRFFSLILYTINVYVLIKISKEVFKKEDIKKIFTFVLITSFMPMFVFSNTGVLADPLTNLLFTAFIWLCLRVLNRGMQIKYIILIIMTIILGSYTRQHFFLALGIFYSLIILASLKNKSITIKLISLITVLLFSPIAITLYGNRIPVISNFRIPEGSLEGLFNFNSNFFYYAKDSIIDHYHKIIPWYFGVYKWLSLTLPFTAYRIIKLLILLSILGLVIGLVKLVKQKQLFRINYIYVFSFLVVLFYYLSFLLGEYYFTSQRSFSFGIQGRYYFPIISLTGILLIVGFDKIFKLLKLESLHLVIGILVIIFNFYSLFYVTKSYYNMQNAQTFMLNISQYKPEFLKNKNLSIFFLSIFLAQIIFLTKSLALTFKKQS